MTGEEQKAIEARIAQGKELLRQKKSWEDWLESVRTVTILELAAIVVRNDKPERKGIDLKPWGSAPEVESIHRETMIEVLTESACANIARLEAEYAAL